MYCLRCGCLGLLLTVDLVLLFVAVSCYRLLLILLFVYVCVVVFHLYLCVYVCFFSCLIVESAVALVWFYLIVVIFGVSWFLLNFGYLFVWWWFLLVWLLCLWFEFEFCLNWLTWFSFDCLCLIVEGVGYGLIGGFTRITTLDLLLFVRWALIVLFLLAGGCTCCVGDCVCFVAFSIYNVACGTGFWCFCSGCVLVFAACCFCNSLFCLNYCCFGCVVFDVLYGYLVCILGLVVTWFGFAGLLVALFWCLVVLSFVILIGLVDLLLIAYKLI